MFSTYTYTDISSGFFKAAKERFREYPNLQFAVLDISQDLQTQGIQQNSYDLVVAANVSTERQIILAKDRKLTSSRFYMPLQTCIRH